MAAYTTVDLVKECLPDDVSEIISDGEITTLIGRASAYVDQAVGPAYAYNGSQKFSDSPNAPPLIDEITRWKAAEWAWVRLKEANQLDHGTQGGVYRRMAADALEQIRNGDIELAASGASLASAAAYITTLNTDRVFTRGEYTNGVLQGDPGTLDNL